MIPERQSQKVFIDKFGREPEFVACAPGRVNLIGDHTDYNDGFVMPAAINFGTYISANIRSDKSVNVVAIDYQNAITTFSLDSIEVSNTETWSNYVRGTVLEILKSYPNISGADITISGNIPQGAGLSSSASLEVAIVKIFSLMNDLNISGVEAAKIGQSAENNFVGCQCGIMDQLSSACGKKNNVMQLDCRDLEYDFAQIPEELSIVIINSNVKRGLVDSAYNERREQCEAAARYFNVDALRDVSIEMLTASEKCLNSTLFSRAKHVVTENARVVEALHALSNNNISKLSQLMRQSHCSLREDFEVTTPEIDYLVHIISDLLGDKGGVRMTGGGFGGCVVALTPNQLVDDLILTVETQYENETGLTADVFVCTAEDGAFFG